MIALTTPAARNSQPSRFPVRAAISAPTAANVIEVGMKPSVAPQVSPPAGPITALAASSTTVTPNSVHASLPAVP